MNLSESLRTAILSILSNKLRSFLTMLGVVIGVAAVVAMLGLGEGMREQIISQIGALGSNQVTVVPGTVRQRPGMPFARPGEKLIDWQEFKELEARKIPQIEYLVAQNTTNLVITYKGTSTRGRVVCTTTGYPEVYNFQIERGRFFNERELIERSRVAVLGKTMAEELFGSENPLGKKIRIGRVIFEVIGVTGEKKLMGQDYGNQVMIPLTTAQARLTGSRDIQLITAKARSEEDLDLVAQFLEGFFTRKLEDPDKFSILNQQDILETIQQVTGTITLFLGAIAGISLLVGGIGIMNIMLVSVTERTREIGLRKAIGAKPADILLQFVIESSILSFLGGGIGVLLGLLGADFTSRFSQFQPQVSLSVALLALSISAGVGLFFGIYPAKRASKLNPIAALRYE